MINALVFLAAAMVFPILFLLPSWFRNLMIRWKARRLRRCLYKLCELMPDEDDNELRNLADRMVVAADKEFPL